MVNEKFDAENNVQGNNAVSQDLNFAIIKPLAVQYNVQYIITGMEFMKSEFYVSFIRVHSYLLSHRDSLNLFFQICLLM